MQIDLFPSPGEVREKCGKVRKSLRTSSSAASGNGNCGRPHFPFPEVRGSAERSHFHAARRQALRTAEPEERDVASQIREYMNERRELETALMDAMDCEEHAEKELAPYQAAFSAAHRQLEQAWERDDVSHVERLTLYTERMKAGHVRHPFKVNAEEAAGWRKRVEHQLKGVNMAIERLTGGGKRRRA